MGIMFEEVKGESREERKKKAVLFIPMSESSGFWVNIRNLRARKYVGESF